MNAVQPIQVEAAAEVEARAIIFDGDFQAVFARVAETVTRVAPECLETL
jgi:hypothetical protein